MSDIDYQYGQHAALEKLGMVKNKPHPFMRKKTPSFTVVPSKKPKKGKPIMSEAEERAHPDYLKNRSARDKILDEA